MFWTTSRSRSAYMNVAVKSPMMSNAYAPVANRCERIRLSSAAIVRITCAYSGTSMSLSRSAARAYAHSLVSPAPPQSHRSGYGMIWWR